MFQWLKNLFSKQDNSFAVLYDIRIAYDIEQNVHAAVIHSRQDNSAKRLQKHNLDELMRSAMRLVIAKEAELGKFPEEPEASNIIHANALTRVR